MRFLYLEATAGFEPAHSGFADRRVNQLRHVAMSRRLTESRLFFKLFGNGN